VPLVLVADDDADLRDLVAAKLVQAGLDVITAENGQGALDQARARRPALAVLDVSLAGLSGIDVCRMLRADPATADTLIVMLTARIPEKDIPGADDWFSKPFSPRELIARIIELTGSPS
jgi:DNA-binding response OmpR family regulator